MASERAGRGDPRMARQVNDRRALDLFSAHGPMTRTQLRELTGLAQPTIIDLVKRLESAGLIEVAGSSSITRPGPRPLLYGLTRGVAFVAMAHVLDQRVVAATADLAGDETAHPAITEPVAMAELPDQIAGMIERAVEAAGHGGRRPTHVVVSVPGVVDRRSGDLDFSWDLRPWQRRLLGPLQERLGAPVELINGVHLVALAEGRHHGLEDEDEYALVWIGTGLGLSLVAGGRPYAGVGGAAGQIGFMPVPGAPVATVDRSSTTFDGDLQGLLGAAAVQDLAAGFGLARSSVGATVADAVEADGPLAAHFVTELARRIAVALAVITTVVDPGRFILHGETGLAGGERLAEAVAAQLATMTATGASVTVGRLSDGDDAALQGARLVAERRARRSAWGGLDASLAVH